MFKIVPVLNPDGVARGYWRTDCNNVNLNRMYSDPDVDLYPTIYHVKRLIEQEHNRKSIFAYIDLHGHASKRGCFLFGNSIAGEMNTDRYVE